MAMLRTLMKYKNSDLTSDLNHQLRHLANKGVFFGGEVTPVAGSLQVDVQQFATVGNDGMVTLMEGLPERLTVTAGISQFIILHAQYRANNSPIATLEVMADSTYNALSDADKDVRVKFAKIVLAAGASEVPAESIYYTETDSIDPIERFFIRGKVATKTDLLDWSDPPTGDTTVNRSGDIYFVMDERLFYEWTTVGTPQWSRIISAAEEVALANHKRNEDDGTVPPDLFNAQHITVVQRESVDDGPASLKTFGASGSGYGTGNALIDEKYPTVVPFRCSIVVSSSMDAQLTGKFYIGKGAIGDANRFFRLAIQSTNKQFLGANGRPIIVSELRDATNTFQLNPSTDSDDFGFYEDPWISFSVAATGYIDVLGYTQKYLGQISPADVVDPIPMGFELHAASIPVATSTAMLLPHTPSSVQDAVDTLDARLGKEPLYYGSVVTVGPTGSGADFEGSNQTPFQNALNRIYTLHTAGKRSGTIFVLPGDYAFTQPLLLRDPTTSTPLDFIKIVGVSSSGQRAYLWTTLKQDRARFYAAAALVGPLFTVTGNQTIEFHNLHLDASRTVSSSDFGCIDLYEQNVGNRCVISGCSFGCDTSSVNDVAYIRQYNNSGPNPDMCGDVSILNCTFDTAHNLSYGHLIQLMGGNVTVDGNEFSRGTAAVSPAPHLIKITTASNTFGNFRITNNQVLGTAGNGCTYGSFVRVDSMMSNGSLLIRGNQVLVDLVNSSSNAWLYLNSALGNIHVSDNDVTWNSYVIVLGSSASGIFRVVNNSFKTNYQFGQRLNNTVFTDISHNRIVADCDRSDIAAPARLFPDTAYFKFTNNDWNIPFTKSGSEDRKLYVVSPAKIAENRFVVTPSSATNYAFTVWISGAGVSFVENELDWTNANCTFSDGILLSSGASRCLVKGNRLIGKTGWEASRSGRALLCSASTNNVFEGNVCYNWGLLADDSGTTGSVWLGNKGVSCNSFLDSDTSTRMSFRNNSIEAATDWSAVGNYGFAHIVGAAEVHFCNNTMNWTLASGHNILASSTHPVIYVTGSNVTIADNTWEYKGSNYGVYVNSNATSIHILRNKMGTLDGSLWNNTPLTVIGILIADGGSRIRVEGNEIVKVSRGTAASGSNYACGIYVQSPGTSVIGNYIGGAGTTAANLNDSIYGIFASSATRLEIVDNYITNFRWIMYCASVAYSVINNNRGFGCLAGIYAESSYCAVCNNVIDFNSLTDTGGVAYEGVNDNHVACLAVGGFSKVIGNTFVNLPDVANTTAARVIRGISASMGTYLIGNSIDAACFCTTGIHMASSYSAVMNICAFNHLNRVGYRRASGSPQCYGIRIEGSSTNNDYHHPLIFGNIVGQSGSNYGGPSAYGIYWNISVQVGTVCYGGTIAFNTISGQSGGHWMANGAIVITDGGGAGRVQEIVVIGNQLHGLGFTDSGTNTFGLGTPSQLNNI